MDHWIHWGWGISFYVLVRIISPHAEPDFFSLEEPEIFFGQNKITTIHIINFQFFKNLSDQNLFFTIQGQNFARDACVCNSPHPGKKDTLTISTTMVTDYYTSRFTSMYTVPLGSSYRIATCSKDVC